MGFSVLVHRNGNKSENKDEWRKCGFDGDRFDSG